MDHAERLRLLRVQLDRSIGDLDASWASAELAENWFDRIVNRMAAASFETGPDRAAIVDATFLEALDDAVRAGALVLHVSSLPEQTFVQRLRQLV